MKVAMTVRDWQVLRFIARNKDRLGPVGDAIRKSQMTRQSGEGRQILDLLKRGLVYVSVQDDNPLNAHYKLTEAGKVAAEYGEYEAEFKNGAFVAKECLPSVAM